MQYFYSAFVLFGRLAAPVYGEKMEQKNGNQMGMIEHETS